jgi:hypothetical protein
MQTSTDNSHMLSAVLNSRETADKFGDCCLGLPAAREEVVCDFQGVK